MRAEKQLLLEDIKTKIEVNEAFIVTRYSKLSSVAISDFRAQIDTANSDFEVVPKRVFIKAAEKQGITFEKKQLEGHIGVVFSKGDVVDVTKKVVEFGESNNNAVEVLFGFFDGQLYDSEKVKKLSKLPSKNEMRAQIIGLFEAPMVQTVSIFDALLTSVLFCLQNKAEKDSQK